MTISLIAAIDESGGLGKEGELLFKISQDLKRFRDLTEGQVVIMGRKTYDSIGHALPNRTNIVVTRIQDFNSNDCLVAHSIDQAFDLAEQEDCHQVFIIGGGQIYEQTIDQADKIYLTVVKGDFQADTFFPDYSDFDKIVFEKTGECEGYKFKFLELERSNS